MSVPDSVSAGSELLPCPFCGGEAAPNTTRYGEKTISEQGWDQDTYHGVNCIVCGVNNVSVRGFESEENAASAWNTRTFDPAQGQPGCGEPVAWRTKTGAATTDKRMAEIWRDIFNITIEPLYAAPQPLDPACQIDRGELVAMLQDLASVNLSREAKERQAARMADALIAKGRP